MSTTRVGETKHEDIVYADELNVWKAHAPNVADSARVSLRLVIRSFPTLINVGLYIGCQH